MSYQSTAAKVALRKQAKPELYCREPRCLYQTDDPFCPRHQRSIKAAREWQGNSEVAIPAEIVEDLIEEVERLRELVSDVNACLLFALKETRVGKDVTAD